MNHKTLLDDGQLDLARVTRGKFTAVGVAEFEIPTQGKAYKIDLEVVLTHGDRKVNTNNWSFWAFPEPNKTVRSIIDPVNGGKTLSDGTFIRLHEAERGAIPEQTDFVITNISDSALADYIEHGGKCLLFPHGAELENTSLYYGETSFYPLFRTIPWNAGSSGNSGTLINDHPAMSAFPHGGQCGLPFIWMMRGFLPMEFEPLRKYQVTPIIRGIDHYYSNRNNAYLLEFSVGKGKVLACSLGVLERLKPDRVPQANWGKADAFIPNETIEAAYLLKCFVDYARSNRFRPPANVPRDEFLRLFKIRDNF
jgi:hypothetical protein